MAKIATIRGTFLAPGVSKNNRRYTKENIGRAVTRMQARLSSGQVIPMHTSHLDNAEGNVRATAAKVTAVSQDGDGRGRFEADVLPTEAGKDIAALKNADAIKHVSIFGSWVGDVEADDDGNETAPDLDVTAIDFTHRPGMAAAQLEHAAAGSVWESVDDVEIERIDPVQSEDAPSLLAIFEAMEQHKFVDGCCTTCEANKVYGEAKDPKKPYGDVTYADPGYQADKKKRYPLDTAGHARSAWGYINKAKNAAKYSSAQLARIKSKIKSACKRFGINIASEQEAIDAITEEMATAFQDVLEAYVSHNVSHDAADGTHHDVTVSSYGVKAEDLPKHSKRVAKAALAALVQVNPDMSPDAETTDDDDMECGECGEAVPADALFCPNCGQPVPGAEAAPASGKEESVMDFTPEQYKAVITPEEAAALDPKKDKFTIEEYTSAVTRKAIREDAAEKAKAAADAKAAEDAKANLSEDEKKLAEAKRLVAEDAEKQKSKPVTADDLKAFAMQIVEETTKKVRAEVIDETRRVGGPQRRGIVEKLEGVRAAKAETDPKKLAEMDGEAYREQLRTVFDPMLPQSA